MGADSATPVWYAHPMNTQPLMPLLDVQQVVKHYKVGSTHIQALNGVSFQVGAGVVRRLESCFSSLRYCQQ